MSEIDILCDIMTDHGLCHVQRKALEKVIEEKQQREHGCEYCNSEPGMMPYSGNNRGEFYFDSGEISYEYENSYCSISDSVFINYCPMCGRRLKNE